MISIKDIAKVIGVSPSSVSLTLNGKAKEKRISDELAKKIIETAQQMGYHPNSVAVGLRTGKSKTIGLIVENISNHFFSSLAKIIEDEARKFGYYVVYCSTENDTGKGQEMIQMLYNHQVDGYLITPVHGMEIDIKKLLDKNRPVVLMDRYFENLSVPYVVIDNYSGMKSGMDYLIKSGYKEIGFVTVDIDLLQIKERERGYREAIVHHNLKLRETNILKLSYNSSREDFIASITKFIKNGKGLEAVFFATNYLGIYGLRSIKDLGLTIPGDIAMICFDDHDIFELHSPGITVIKQPINEIAKEAVNILIGELGHTTAVSNSEVILQTEIIVRAST
ncbi:MAG TPA: substrate-binding domain-containing protein [Chitinophagaceae bacterium]